MKISIILSHFERKRERINILILKFTMRYYTYILNI